MGSIKVKMAASNEAAIFHIDRFMKKLLLENFSVEK